MLTVTKFGAPTIHQTGVRGTMTISIEFVDAHLNFENGWKLHKGFKLKKNPKNHDANNGSLQFYYYQIETLVAYFNE